MPQGTPLEPEIRKLIREESDPELTAQEVRLLLEERLGLPRDGLLQRKQEIMEVVQRVEAPIERLSAGEKRAHVVGMAVAGAAITWLLGSPETTFDYVKLAVLAYMGSSVLQSTFGIMAGWYLTNIKGVSAQGAAATRSDELNAWLFPDSTEGRRVKRRRRIGMQA